MRRGAIRNIARSLKRSDKLWQEIEKEHRSAKIIYSLKQKLQTLAAQKGREFAIAVMEVDTPVSDEWVKWFLDTPLDYHNVRQTVAARHPHHHIQTHL